VATGSIGADELAEDVVAGVLEGRVNILPDSERSGSQGLDRIAEIISA
jgi:hypothetical protein